MNLFCRTLTSITVAEISALAVKQLCHLEDADQRAALELHIDVIRVSLAARAALVTWLNQPALVAHDLADVVTVTYTLK